MKKIIHVVIIIITVAISLFAASVFSAYRIAHKSDVVAYQVRPGDTLWTVIEKHCTEEDDVRLYVYLTQEKNNITGHHIHAGDQLVLIIPKH